MKSGERRGCCFIEEVKAEQEAAEEGAAASGGPATVVEDFILAGVNLEACK